MTMYNNRFVMCVLINGIPQKESKAGTVQLPVGIDYALRFRNKHNKRAVVKFFIDGEEASGAGYIIPANGFIDIERFADVAKKFRFVELDSEDAIDYGKNGEQDGTKGLIEARFHLETGRVYPNVPLTPEPFVPYDPYDPWTTPKPYPFVPPAIWANNTTPITNNLMNSQKMRFRGTLSPEIQAIALNSVVYEECEGSMGLAGLDGVTIEGGNSSQRFSSAYIDYDQNNFTTVRILLVGTTDSVNQVNLLIAQKNNLEKDLSIAKMQKQINDLQKQINSIANS
jgi:hypothetical protein